MLTEIISISGQSGLFKLISRGNNAIIVESLIDGKKMPVNSTSRVSALEDISMYTEDGDIKLKKVFVNIFNYTQGAKCLDAKKASSDELKSLMNNVLPNWDKERIYTSDLKKLFLWYNLLLDKNIINKESIEKVENEKEEDNE